MSREEERTLRLSAPLWQAFRHGDECTVLQLLRDMEELRHIDGEGALRAACWYGMEGVARYLVERCAAALSMEDWPGIARRRGHKNLAGWLEDRRLLQAGKIMKELQVSFIA